MTRLAILLAGLMLAPDCAAQAPDDSGGQFRIRNLATGPGCREAAVTFPWGIVRLGYDCTYKGAPAFQASFRLIYSSAFR